MISLLRADLTMMLSDFATLLIFSGYHRFSFSNLKQSILWSFYCGFSGAPSLSSIMRAAGDMSTPAMPRLRLARSKCVLSSFTSLVSMIYIVRISN